MEIEYDPGGDVSKYIYSYDRAKLYGTTIRFSGLCASACTILLGLPPEKVCATPEATFVFHAAFFDPSQTGGEYVQNPEATAWMFANYPQWVQAWLNERGGLSRVDKIMNYATIHKHMRTCT